MAKIKVTKEKASNESLIGKTKGGFPKHTLQEALRVAQGVESANGGQPLPPVELAIALDMSPGGSGFRDILSSSIKYGLTNGSYKNARVSLEELARDVVEPKTDELQQKSIVKAALNPPTFTSIFNYFKGKKLPDTQFFQNTVVREFQVPKEQAELCVRIFNGNMEYAGLIRVASTGRWLSGDVAMPISAVIQTTDELENETAEFAPDRREEALNDGRSNSLPARLGQAIFLGHGKNRKPLEQLKQILDEYKIPYKVAVEEPNKFRPISQKVSETMHECGAAILIFTADEEFKDTEGNIIWRPSENVIYELGASSVLYGKKIIIFKEDSVHFPANFQDIGYISFQKDALSAKAIDLFRELISFGLIKVSVPV